MSTEHNNVPLYIVLGAVAAPAPTATALSVQARQSQHELRSGTTYRIGRGEMCDIRLNDARASWHHATLHFDGSAWVLEDAGSRNGMFLDGQRIVRVKISPPCSIRFGDPDDGPFLHFELAAATGAHAPSGAERDPSALGLLADAEHEISDALAVDEEAGLADVMDRMRGPAEPETE